jgi:ribosomal protein L12E/L44/L45/RPP1/RPP2
VEHAGDSLVFTFAPAHRALKARLEEKRAWIEQLAQTAAGRKIAVITKEGDSGPASAAAPGDPAAAARAAGLKARAKAEPTVQAVLDVFGGEIDDVQELD